MKERASRTVHAEKLRDRKHDGGMTVMTVGVCVCVSRMGRRGKEVAVKNDESG